MSLPEGVTGWADFSDDGKRRYVLGREWAAVLQRVLWIMLNPSTAGADRDDPTIRRCCGFARSWGYGGIVVVNLYAKIATRPIHLAGEPPLFSYREVEVLNDEVRDGTTALIIAAWGANPATRQRARPLTTTLLKVGRDVHCLGKTKDGAPKHPLYVPAATRPQMYRCAA